MKIIFSLLLLLSATLSYSQETERLIKLSRPGYSISYPATWLVDTSGSSQAQFTFFSPKEDDNDDFSENVLLFIVDLSDESITLDKYVDLNAKDIRQNAQGLVNFTSKKLQSASGDFYKLTYDMTYQNFKIYTEQYYFIKDGKGYILNFSSEEGHLKELGQRIMNSFTLTGK